MGLRMMLRWEGGLFGGIAVVEGGVCRSDGYQIFTGYSTVVLAVLGTVFATGQFLEFGFYEFHGDLLGLWVVGKKIFLIFNNYIIAHFK